MVARLCTGAKKGLAKGAFWEKLAFSRIVTRGREQQAVERYIHLNSEEVRFSSESRGTIRAALREAEAIAVAWRLFPPE
jgi:hypothetical protein